MRTDLFDFELPADSIALRPAQPARFRANAGGAARRRACATASSPICRNGCEPGDQLVVNDTKVIAAQLSGRRIGRDTEPKIEATLIKRLDGSRWQALVKPAKKLSQGDVVRFGNEGRVCLLGHLDAQVEHKGDDGEVTLSFSFHGPTLDQAIADLGAPPLPPYIASKRAPDERDAADYQTMFAANEGAVAAPTAGLHFTPALEAALARARRRHSPDHAACRGRDVSAGQGRRHRRAQDAFRVGHDLRRDRRCAQRGAGQGRPHRRGRHHLAAAAGKRRRAKTARSQPFAGETAIFITPGYRFRAVDILLTNFHLPRSTLFMLVSAFSGLETMKRAYAHAIASGYRFYSYGDACLLFP